MDRVVGKNKREPNLFHPRAAHASFIRSPRLQPPTAMLHFPHDGVAASREIHKGQAGTFARDKARDIKTSTQQSE